MPEARRKSLVVVVGTLNGGGAEKVAATLGASLGKRGWDVRFVLANADSDDGTYAPVLAAAGVPVERLPVFRKFATLRKLLPLRRAIVRAKPDVVLSFLVYTNILSALALFGSGIPLVPAERNNYRVHLAADRRGRAMRGLLKFVYGLPHVRAITAVSERLAEMIAEDFAPGKPVVAIPNGLDVAALERAMAAELAPEELALFGEQTVIACGRLTPQKNFALLLRAFARGGPFSKQARLIVLGQGELEGELRALAEELGIADRVAFPGFRANPHAWVSKATLFVLSSDFEGCPNALAEALFTNGCCVSTDCPTGPAELVDDGVDGLLVPRGDERALSDAIETLLSDAALRARLSKKARARAAANSLEARTDAFDALLREAAGFAEPRPAEVRDD